ncbi:MAG: FAD-dependent oxidoreductase [Paracoccaceae bacterium]|nr:FAD-dependent oxidoreductase [Paracoccaceae bacterium]
MTKPPQHVAVIGAGIVGVSTAIWLRRFGAEVTLIDRGAPEGRASYGNAGVLAACAVLPVTGPGLIRKAPGMLLDRNAPLFLRWAYLPRLLPWLRKYLSHANDADTRRLAAGLAPLTSDSPDQHLALTEGLRAQRFVTQSDYAYAFADRAAWEADGYGWALRAEHGFVPEVLEGVAVQDYEPALGPSVGCLAVLKDHGFVQTPGEYIAALLQDFEDLGGRMLEAEVQDLTLEDGQVRQLETTAGPIPCDQAVVTVGAWSATLLKRLGLKIPLESERGYHVHFEGTEGAPQMPILLTMGQFAATPMQGGLRCAGVLEFGGLQAPPSRAPFELLRRSARAVFPGLQAAKETEWMGHRPALPDSLPVIGEVGQTGVFAGFGHHHVGLTAGPRTGRMLAAKITGRPVNIDLAPYRPERFA